MKHTIYSELEVEALLEQRERDIFKPSYSSTFGEWWEANKKSDTLPDKGLTKDEFAKFMYSIGISRDNYNYDIVHDLGLIDKMSNEKLSNGSINTLTPDITEFRLFVRPLGTHMWCKEINDPSLLSLIRESADSIEYKITICWNCDYLYHVSFATIESRATVKNSDN